MALEKQISRFGFAAGVDTKPDPLQLQPPQLLLCENGIFVKPGKIKKRPGTKTLPSQIFGTTSNIVAGQLLTTYQSQLFCTDGTESYSLSTVQQKLVPKGSCESLSITSSSMVGGSEQFRYPDLVVHPSGITVLAYVDSGSTCYYSVYDTNTQQLLNRTFLATTNQRPKTVTVGNYVLIFYQVANTLSFVPIPILAPNVPGTPRVVANDVNANGAWDITYIGNAATVAYCNNVGGTDNISLRQITSQLTIGSATLIPLSPLGAAVSCCHDVNENVWVSWWDGDLTPGLGTIYATIYDVILVHVLLAVTVIDAAAGLATRLGSIVETEPVFGQGILGARASLTYTDDSVPVTYTSMLDYNGTVSVKAATTRGVRLSSKPWIVNGQCHHVARYRSTLQSTWFVYTSDGTLVGQIAPRIGWGFLSAQSRLPEVTQTSPGVFVLPTLHSQNITVTGGQINTNPIIFSTTLDYNVVPTAIEKSFNLHVSGGMLYNYDGASIDEHNFVVFPDDIIDAISTVGGALGIPVGTAQYQYQVIYEYTDAQGIIHKSAPSSAVQTTVVTASGNTTSSVQLIIPTLRQTNKSGQVLIKTYRTQANQIIFYLVDTTVNDMTVDTITIVDVLADSAIIGNEQIYTTGGDLEALAPPAPAILAQYKNRVIVVPSESPYDWWFSKDVIQGQPVEFNDSLYQSVSQLGGPITAIHQLDANICIFKRNHIFMTAGDGPAPNGTQLDYAPAGFVTADAGCKNQRSIVVIPDGLLFESEKGIYLINRSQQIEYRGSAVEDYVIGSSVTSAVNIPYTTQVRFTMSSGVILVYDWYVNQWAAHTGLPAVDSTIFQNFYTLMKTDGTILQEDPTSFTDNGAAVHIKLRTPWLTFAGMEGFQRVWRMLVLGSYVDPHKLRLTLAYDYNPDSQYDIYINADQLQTTTYGTDTPYGIASPYGGDYPREQYRVQLPIQKCEALQITLEDIPLYPYGESCSLSGLAFEVGVKKGLYKMKTTRTVG